MPKKKTEDAVIGEEIMEPIIPEGAENSHEQEETPEDADAPPVPDADAETGTVADEDAGGVFCNLPDDTVCLCLYSAQHSDKNFAIGDSVIIVIRQYDYGRQFIFGRILAKW